MNCIEGLEIKREKDKISIYQSCIIGKAHKQPFSNKNKHANDILDVIICDLDYFNTTNFGGTK